jgi:hypothetical protein
MKHTRPHNTEIFSLLQTVIFHQPYIALSKFNMMYVVAANNLSQANNHEKLLAETKKKTVALSPQANYTD